MLKTLMSGCLVAAFAFLATAGTALAADVTIFAAASLREALDAAVARYEADTGADVVVSYAGSSALARQIDRGAPANLFISANRDWMDRLEASGTILGGTRVDLLANALVLVETGAGPAAAPDTMLTPQGVAEAVGSERIAMALVEAVPAGIYGAEALRSFGLWDALSGQVVQSDNVRAALALVERGEAPFGIVYATDARIGAVHTVGTFPADSHAPIIYPMAIVAGNDGEAVRGIYDFLRSAEAWPVFEAAGFIRPPHP